jgi:outer membrane protein TolC
VLNVQLSYRSRVRTRSRAAVLIGAIAILEGGCTTTAASANRGAATPATVNESRSVAHPGSPGTPVGEAELAPASEADLGGLERSLAEEAKLPAIIRIALAKNPELSEARERARAAREIAPAGSRLPDPEFEYQLWAAPLARPYALDEAQMHMFGVRQNIPPPGSLGAQEQTAVAQADIAFQARRAREQELIARVRRAYAEYYRAEREYRVHLEHVRLAQQALDIARAAYQGGRGTQQDVLRAAVEMSRLHNDVASVDGDRRTARALLNTLMARRVDTPLGPPAAIEPAKIEVRAQELERLVDGRPEIAAALSAIRARESEVEAARASGRWPSFMLGVQYMYMPPMEDPHNYGVMFSMSLPWLNPRYGEEARAAEARVAAERQALSSSRNAARYELYAAAERLKAARESLAIVERDLLPQAEQSFESAQAVYRGGQTDSLALFDALRSLLDVRIERERVLVRVENALTDVERAIGRPIPVSTTTERGHHD